MFGKDRLAVRSSRFSSLKPSTPFWSIHFCNDSVPFLDRQDWVKESNTLKDCTKVGPLAAPKAMKMNVRRKRILTCRKYQKKAYLAERLCRAWSRKTKLKVMPLKKANFSERHDPAVGNGSHGVLTSTIRHFSSTEMVSRYDSPPMHRGRPVIPGSSFTLIIPFCVWFNVSTGSIRVLSRVWSQTWRPSCHVAWIHRSCCGW